LHSLRSKLFVLTVLLVGITQFGTLITTVFMAQSDATRQAQANLSVGDALFNELIRGRIQSQIKVATDMAAKVSTNTDHEASLTAESDAIGAGFSLLLDNDGDILASSNKSVSGAYPKLVSRAGEEGIARSTLVQRWSFL